MNCLPAFSSTRCASRVAVVSAVVLLLTDVPATSQELLRGAPDSARVVTSIFPTVATLGSRSLAKIPIKTTSYGLKSELLQAGQVCSVSPEVEVDKIDRDILNSQATSLKLCSDLARCWKPMSWSPSNRDGKTALRGMPGLAPGTFFLSWDVGSYPDAALSNYLTFNGNACSAMKK